MNHCGATRRLSGRMWAGVALAAWLLVMGGCRSGDAAARAGGGPAAESAAACGAECPGPYLCSGFYVDHRKEPALYDVYFGTYTKDRDQSIYHYTLETSSGELKRVGGVGGMQNPSFLAVDPGGRWVYSVCEADAGGGAAALERDPQTGELTLLNIAASGEKGSCHIALSPAGTAVVTANYGSGSVAAFPVREDATLGDAVSIAQHEGSGPNERRQAAPHAHSVTFDPTGRFLIAADLGTDELRVYTLDEQTAELTPHAPPAFDLHPGAGPRHVAFHPGGRWAYAINELDATMTAAAWDAESGTLKEFQKISTLPEGYEGRQSTAEVVVHPDGRFLYGSNRGHDSLVIYAIDPDTGRLSLVGHEMLPGDEPRNFNLDPTGRWLITCHQNSDTAQVYAVDGDTGTLTAVGDPVPVPMPVCVKFVAR